MKKMMFMLMLVGVFFITGCDGSTGDDSIECGVNQVEQKGVCVDKTPDALECEDNEEEVDGVCVVKEEDDPILTTEDKFDSYVDKVETYFNTQNRISTQIDLDMIMFTSTEVLFHSTIQVDSIYDENESYYYEELNQVHDDATDNEQPVQTFDSVIINYEDSMLHQYTMHNRQFELDYEEENGDFIVYAESIDAMNGFDLSSADFQIQSNDSDYEFITTVALGDFLMGRFEIDILTDLGLEAVYNVDVPIIVTFDQSGYKTTIELPRVLIELQAEDLSTYTLSLEFSQEIVVGQLGDIIDPFFGGWMYILPETKEEIVFDAPMYVEPYQVDYYVNDIGWISFDLEPGFYSFYVNGSPESLTYQVFDEEGNELLYNYRMEATEEQTVYIKVDSDMPQMVSINFEPIILQDIVIEEDLPILGGTITGHNEGQNDYNAYYMDGVAPYDGLLVLDVRNIDFDDFFVISYGNGFGCWANDADFCHVEIKQGEEFYFEIHGAYEGDYDFSYSFNELLDYPSDINTMRNVNEFSESNPIYLGEETNEVYVKLEITEANKTVIMETLIDGSAKLIYNVELYTSDGTLLISDFRGYHDLDVGTYLIRFTKSIGTLIVSPNILVYDRN